MYRAMAMEQVRPKPHPCGHTVGSSALTANPTADALETVSPVGQAIPSEVEFILTALEAGGHPHQGAANRRQGQRTPFRSVVHLRLFSDAAASRPWVLYARDVNRKALGFITRHRLPLGYGGTLLVRARRGQSVSADCTVHRCRETVSGWFEGCLTFNRAQWSLEEE